MRAIKNIMRRKSRSMLTVCGIAIGVFLIVVLGALAERNNIMNSSDSKFKEHRVTITEKNYFSASGMGIPDRLLSAGIIRDIEKVSGVKKTIPQVVLPFDPNEVVPIGTPKMILGGFMGNDMRNEWRFVLGRSFSEKDRNVVVVGANLVKRLHAKVGKNIKLRNKEFKIVGILDSTLTSLDASVFIPLNDARKMYIDSLPKSLNKEIKSKDIAIQITVYPEPGQDADALAASINKKIKNVNATGPSGWKKQANSLSVMIYAISVVLGSIAFFAGGLLTMNTMMISVFERTREVGIERAMGASKIRVIREFLAEALVIGALGGLIGLLLGAMTVYIINVASANTGMVLFAMTLPLAIKVMVIAAILSTLAGFYPALHAARLNPVTAIAYE